MACKTKKVDQVRKVQLNAIQAFIEALKFQSIEGLSAVLDPNFCIQFDPGEIVLTKDQFIEMTIRKFEANTVAADMEAYGMSCDIGFESGFGYGSTAIRIQEIIGPSCREWNFRVAFRGNRILALTPCFRFAQGFELN